jgi:hypothetical protein
MEFDGIRDVHISDKVDRVFREDVDKDYLENAVGIVYNDKYYFSYTPKGQTVNTKTLVLDYETKSITTYDYGIISAATADDGTLYGGATDGYVYKLEQTTNDDDETYSVQWKSGKLPLGSRPGEIGALRNVHLWTDTQGVNLTVNFYVDDSLVRTATVNTTSESLSDLWMPMGTIGRWVEVEFTASGTDEITIYPHLWFNPRPDTVGGKGGQSS